jgi:hypothetical protein
VDLLPYAASVDIASGNVTRFGGRIAGIDGVMPQLDLVLKQDPDNKLNPQDQNSTWNKVGGQYNPLLAPMREITILTAITLPGVTPTNHDWIGLFHGYLGDGIRVEGDTVRVNCRSLSKRLQETYIEEPKDYGSEEGEPLEDVIQNVLDDNGLSDVVLYCPEPTGFMVETYSAENVQYKTVWDVLQALATAHDFFLGDLWDPVTERMRLTLLVPPRDKDINTADFVLNYRSDFLREEREIRDTAVRNVIIGHYWDKAANEKRTITVKDDTSIAEFGRRAMEVEEEATSLIQTEAEMLTYLNAILSDLKDQQGTSYLSMPFFPQIGLFSGLVIHHPAMSSTDDFMGVESYRHSLDFEGREYRTEIVGSGRIRGGQQKWLKSETKPGSPGHPSTPPTSNVPPANVVWGHCSFITDVNLAWEPVRGATAYEIRTSDTNWGYADGIIYRGNSLSHRFIPTQREYTLYIRAINQAGLYSNQATPITLSLPAPAAPNQPTVTAYFNALKIVPTPLNSPSVLGYYIHVTNGDVTDKIPVLAGGDYSYPTPSGTTVTIQVSAYDILGEGPKSEPLEATTTALTDGDIPDDIVGPSKLTEDLRSDIDLSKYTAGQAAILKPQGGKLWHFDATLDSTDGLKPLPGAVATLRPGEGRFGGAVAVEEATTNLFNNPTFINQAQYWLRHGDKTIEIEDGNGCIKFMKSLDGNSGISQIIDTVVGEVYTVSYWVQHISGVTNQYAFAITPSNDRYTKIDHGDTIIGTFFHIPDDGEWHHVQHWFVSESTSNQVFIQPGRNIENLSCFLANAQLEKKPFATSFVESTRPDGIVAYSMALSQDHTIVCHRKGKHDTDYRHVAKRSDGTVLVDGEVDEQYDTGWISERNLLPNSSFNENFVGWTNNANVDLAIVDCALRVTFKQDTSTPGIKMVPRISLEAGTYTMSTRIRASCDNLLFTFFSGSAISPSFEHLATSWQVIQRTVTIEEDADDAILYLLTNGQEIDSYWEIDWVKLEKGNTATDWTPAPEDLGCDGDTLMFSNQTGLIDELLILTYAATDEEIATWYRAKGAFVDQDELNYQASQVKQLGTELGDRLTDAEVELVNAQNRLVDAEDSIDAVSITLQTHADQIQARVTQTVFNSLEGRVTDNETELTVLAGEVSSRVTQAVFDLLEGRVTGNEATLTTHAAQIQARVTQDIYDTLEGRVTNAEGSLDVLADEISAKVSQAVFDTLAGTVSSQGAQITAQAGLIEQKADAIIVTAHGARITTAEQNISALDGAITSTVARVDDVEGDVATQANQVTQLADRYSVKTQKTSGGKTYATGFVSGINEQNESEFAVLADRFRVFGTTTSDGQAIFAVDTVTKKAYFLADLIVNGLVRATALEAEQLKTHMIQAGYAVFDEANILDLEARKILAAGGAIEIGEEGIMMIPPGYAQRSMHLDGAQLAFWDKNNMPSIAMGDLTKFKQDIANAGMLGLFPTGFTFPQAGFLMAQGNIALARSVLANSLMEIPPMLLSESGVPFERLASNSVRGRVIAAKAITFDKIAENLNVPLIGTPSLRRYNSTTVVSNTNLPSTWTTVSTFSFIRTDTNYFAEQLLIEVEAALETLSGGDSSDHVQMRLLGPSNQILMVVTGSNGISQLYSVILDARNFPAGTNTFTIQARHQHANARRIIINRRTVYQNEQMPLRPGVPVYTVSGGIGGCYTGCEVACESSCESSCQSGCEGSCQDTCETSCQGCQVSCQSTCEKTSQSGGGCIREGTPIDVWDLETQDYTTVPVEDLKPGMILPWYQPETDTVVHGELTRLVDASYSREFLRIRTSNGPSLDVTFEQPFDVLADLGQGQRWYKLQALYLRPGMQMVRPFDSEPLSTIVSVETVRESGVHFWDPKTTTGGYCVNGYADTITK